MKSDPERIIILSHMYPRVGDRMSGTFVRELVNGLKPIINSRLMVIVPVPWWPQWLPLGHWKKYIGQPEFELIDGTPHYFIRYPMLPSKYCFPLQAHGMVWAVTRLLRQLHEPDQRTILHSHALLPDGYAGAQLATHFGYKHICTLHGCDINTYPFRTRLTYNLSVKTLQSNTAFIAVSNAIARRAQNISPVKNITVIHNGADDTRFFSRERIAVKIELGLQPERRYVLFVGSLQSVKGVDLLLHGFAATKQENTELLLAGDGPEREALMVLARQLRIDTRVRFVGYVPHESIPLWMNAADLLIIASRSEGFPTIIPEAMMCGLPVIATDVGGISDAVITGETGVLVPPEDSQQLSAALEMVLGDNQLLARLSAGALNFAKKLTWQTIAASTREYYSEVVNH